MTLLSGLDDVTESKNIAGVTCKKGRCSGPIVTCMVSNHKELDEDIEYEHELGISVSSTYS